MRSLISAVLKRLRPLWRCSRLRTSLFTPILRKPVKQDLPRENSRSKKEICWQFSTFTGSLKNIICYHKIYFKSILKFSCIVCLVEERLKISKCEELKFTHVFHLVRTRSKVEIVDIGVRPISSSLRRWGGLTNSMTASLKLFEGTFRQKFTHSIRVKKLVL